MGTLKEALVKTIKNINLALTEAAFENDLAAGSTAVVALLVDGQILVANVDDSKALLCSEKLPLHREADGASIPYLPVKELTSDHNPHTDEERARIEAAGGVISWYDMPIINGHFPMTRALSDVPLKRGKGYYGMKVHQAVIASGARYSSPTIHFMDEHYDTGIPLLKELYSCTC